MHLMSVSIFQFVINAELLDPTQTFIASPLMIIHEHDSFPLENVGRYLYEFVAPGTRQNIFYSKSITIRLNHGGQPCNSQPLVILNKSYDYDQVSEMVHASDFCSPLLLPAQCYNWKCYFC